MKGKLKKYLPFITGNINKKGVLDIDTIKGCSLGMKKYPNGGCYGICYANRIAKLYNYDFKNSVSRLNENINQLYLFYDFRSIISKSILKKVKNHKLLWFRIGTMGDPCHNWELTLNLCLHLYTIKIPVIVTKHWIEIPDCLLSKFKSCKVIFNTSISALDTKKEIKYRLMQYKRIKNFGIKSILRIVSCNFGNTQNGKKLKYKQQNLFENEYIIDNPLRISNNDCRVLSGDIVTEKIKDLNGKKNISIFNKNTYIGSCFKCPDQCGVNLKQ